MVKLGFTGVYIIFLITAQNRLVLLVRTDSPIRVLTSTHNLCYERKYEKYQNFLSEKNKLGGKSFSIFELACFRNGVSSLCIHQV